MKKCKNIECSNETLNNRVYCSLKCRNYYVNKYLRDYTKNGESISNKAKNSYLLSPKKCKKCNGVITYEYRERDYCSKKCSSSCTNINRKGIKYNMSSNGIDVLRKSAYNKLHHINYDGYTKIINEYNENPKICPNCSKPIEYLKRKLLHCSKKCLKEYRRKCIDKFLLYKSDSKFKFNLKDYPEEFDFSLIEKYGWYSPSNSKKPNIGGVSRDHKISISEGFLLGIDAKLISHPANCELMIHSDNISKNKKSTLSLDELISKIMEWDLKYKNKQSGL
jgi:hypothetical protein